MRKYTFVLFSCLLLWSFTAVAQSDRASETVEGGEYNSLLWEISGNGLKKTSYLYGTIHLIGSDDFFMTETTKKKFAKTKQLALEIDMDDPMLMFKSMMGMMMKGGKTLEDYLTPEEYKKVEQHFSETLGLPMAMLKRVKPMLISSLAMEQSEGSSSIGGGGTQSYEMEFVKMAKAEEMEILGLESVEYQISVLDSIPYEEQAKMLLESIDGEGDMGAESFDAMVELYKKQDLDGLLEMIQGSESDLGDFEETLLNNRNRNWIPVIGEMGRKMPTFFAVGAGHLPGKYGVINLLREAGYKVKPLQ